MSGSARRHSPFASRSFEVCNFLTRCPCRLHPFVCAIRDRWTSTPPCPRRPCWSAERAATTLCDAATTRRCNTAGERAPKPELGLRSAPQPTGSFLPAQATGVRWHLVARWSLRDGLLVFLQIRGFSSHLRRCCFSLSSLSQPDRLTTSPSARICHLLSKAIANGLG